MLLGLWVHRSTRAQVGTRSRCMAVPGDGAHLGWHVSSWTTRDTVSFPQKS